MLLLRHHSESLCFFELSMCRHTLHGTNPSPAGAAPSPLRVKSWVTVLQECRPLKGRPISSTRDRSVFQGSLDIPIPSFRVSPWAVMGPPLRDSTLCRFSVFFPHDNEGPFRHESNQDQTLARQQSCRAIAFDQTIVESNI